MPQQNDVGEAGVSASNFIRSIIASAVEAGRTRILVTRFPPEPIGYLHLEHAKSIVLNYELAKEFGGRCNLRLDDTNPAKERVEYIDAIKRDVQWLGFDWAQGLSVRTYCRSSLKPISTLRSPPAPGSFCERGQSPRLPTLLQQPRIQLRFAARQ